MNNEDQSVLTQAWRLFNRFDRTASDLKNRSKEGRQNVIYMISAASIFAILAGVIPWSDGLGQWLGYALVLLAGILPVTSRALFSDVVQFTGTTDWIKARYIAEMMRMHIFLFRMSAGPYGEEPEPSLRDDLLIKNLEKVRTDAKWDGVLPLLKYDQLEEGEYRDFLFSVDQEEAYQSAFDHYYKWRVIDQIQWYQTKLEVDYASMRRYFRIAQWATVVGSIIGGIAGFIQFELVVLISILNVLTAMVDNISAVNMSGQTYSIFMIAERKLNDAQNFWAAQQNNVELQDPEAYHDAQAAFVQRVESILMWEREEWYELALQAQAAGDRAIVQDLDRLNKRADEGEEVVDDTNGAKAAG